MTSALGCHFLDTDVLSLKTGDVAGCLDTAVALCRAASLTCLLTTGHFSDVSDCLLVFMCVARSQLLNNCFMEQVTLSCGHVEGVRTHLITGPGVQAGR